MLHQSTYIVAMDFIAVLNFYNFFNQYFKFAEKMILRWLTGVAWALS